MKKRKKMEMDIINSNAAGIDIGSKSHYVAVGQALEDVKEFGGLNPMALHQWQWNLQVITGKIYTRN